MKLMAYTVFDVASGVYDNPFFMQSDAQAIRAFGDIANNLEHPIGKHPKDFTLFRVGTFDNTECELIGDSPPRPLQTALEAQAAHRKIAAGQLDAFDATLNTEN